LLILNAGYCNRTNKKAVEKTSLPPANLSAIIWTLLPSTFFSLYYFYYYQSVLLLFLRSLLHSILFLLLNFHEFFIIFGHPDTFLLFPLVAPILCYVVMPRHFPYSLFPFCYCSFATVVNLLVNDFVTTGLYNFYYTYYILKSNKQ